MQISSINIASQKSSIVICHALRPSDCIAWQDLAIFSTDHLYLIFLLGFVFETWKTCFQFLLVL